jgi:hypothetical protein
MGDFPESLKGKTCASCKLLVPIYCHPWNERIGKGQMSEQLGFVCTLFALSEGKLIFSEKDDDVCECHTPKEQNND